MTMKARPKPPLTPEQVAERKRFAERLMPIRRPFDLNSIAVPAPSQDMARTREANMLQLASKPAGDLRSNAARKAWETRRAKSSATKVATPVNASPKVQVAPFAFGNGTLAGLKIRFDERAANRAQSKPVGIKALVIACYPHIQAALTEGANLKEIAEDMTAEFGIEIRYGTLRNYFGGIAKEQPSA